ncbi:MAG: RNA pyrophosphohydrolase [Hyphomicrobiales bacterium]|nr:MAG: RNA pyrophosphohydrolase [Hyphomicrobiales bacterium]
MIDKEKLPYRPCVGVILFNSERLVWVGKRVAGSASDAEGQGHWWQAPQGGIDKGEDAAEAAVRELYEETNIRSASILSITEDWLTYDLPEHLIGKAWKGRYRGQKQKWVAMRFEGDDSEIDVLQPGGGKHKAEFCEWRWERLAALPELIVPFKRGVYEQVVKAFSDLGA